MEFGAWSGKWSGLGRLGSVGRCPVEVSGLCCETTVLRSADRSQWRSWFQRT